MQASTPSATRFHHKPLQVCTLPSQMMMHLDALIYTLDRVVRPIPEKIQDISLLTEYILAIGHAPVWCLQ